jgi:hypothetical protein
MPCHLRRPDQNMIGGGGAPDPATRHPVTERSEVEVPRSESLLIPGIFHPVQSTTTSGKDTR